MSINERYLLGIATIIFASALMIGVKALLEGRRHSRPLLWTLLALAFTFQSIGLYLRGLSIGACPLGNTYEILHFIIWSTVLIVLIVGPVFNVNLLGLCCAFLCTIFGVLSLALPGIDQPYSGRLFGGDPLVELHAALAVFGYGCLALLAMISTLYLLQFNALERKKHAPIFSFLPSLLQLERLQARALIAASLFLVVSVLSGLFLLSNHQLSLAAQVKLFLVTLVSLAYLALLGLLLKHQTSPRRVAIASLFLFGASIFSLGPVDAARSRESSIPYSEKQSARND
ncbi:MAG: cytochrome c biogenesis protein CcsA [Puniceicoccaceae bacterium]